MLSSLLSFFVSLFHSILLLLKLAAISILWMILAEAFGYTTSAQTIKRVARVRRRKVAAPLPVPPPYTNTAMAARMAVPVSNTHVPVATTMPTWPASAAVPLPTTKWTSEVEASTSGFTATPAVITLKKDWPSSKEERRRSRTSSMLSSRSARSSSSSMASSSRSSSRSKAASVSSTTAHVSTRRASRSSGKTEKDREKEKVKSRSTERVSGWRRERSSSRASRIGIF